MVLAPLLGPNCQNAELLLDGISNTVPKMRDEGPALGPHLTTEKSHDGCAVQWTHGCSPSPFPPIFSRHFDRNFAAVSA